MRKQRCQKCNKKIKSIIPLQCKCKNYYCNLHRLSSDHDCSFDHVKAYRNILEKNNVKIVANKLDIITSDIQ